MTSPFTLKRYFLAALVMSAVVFVPAALLMRGHSPIWLAFMVALLVGFNVTFGLWFTGEIAWRGARSSRLRPVGVRKILIRLAAGIGLIILSPYIPEMMWGLDEDMVAGVVGLIAWVTIIYAVGQLIGLWMKKKDRTSA